MVPWSQKRQQILRGLHNFPEDLPPPKARAGPAVLAQVAHGAQGLANNLLRAAMLRVQVPWKTEADLLGSPLLPRALPSQYRTPSGYQDFTPQTVSDQKDPSGRNSPVLPAPALPLPGV